MPAVVFVFGFPDGVEMIGGKLKDTNAYISWARLTAATGFTSIQYETVEPLKDIYKVLEYVTVNADSLKIDDNKIGLWVCSGNTPTALRVLMDDTLAYPQCAVIYYGIKFSHLVSSGMMYHFSWLELDLTNFLTVTIHRTIS